MSPKSKRKLQGDSKVVTGRFAGMEITSEDAIKWVKWIAHRHPDAFNFPAIREWEAPEFPPVTREGAEGFASILHDLIEALVND